MIYVMRRIKHLTDAYAFPGFRPLRKVRGLFGDHVVRIITLRRRRKESSAGPVVQSIGPAMITADV